MPLLPITRMFIVKKNLHYYSDCAVFGGCENMLVNFLTSPLITSDYNIGFSFRYSKKYVEGLRKRISVFDFEYPVSYLYTFKLCSCAKKNRFIRTFLLLFDHFFVKYPALIYNTVFLYRHFKSKKIDILHINNGGYPAAYSCQAAVIAAKLCGIKKILYVVNNIAITYKNPTRWFDYPVDKLVSKYVDKFATGSVFAGNCLSSVLGLPASKILNIHNGIFPRAIHTDRETYRNKHGYSENQVITVVVAHLEKRKGHIYLLQTFSQMRREYKPLPLLVIEGDGPEKLFLVNYVKKNNLSDFVKFIGVEPCVFDLINAADFVILPSIAGEDFPNIVLEAMALGKPVIGSNVAGIPEQIIHGETGYIVQPKSISEMMTTIQSLLSDQSLRNAMGAAAKRQFKKSFYVDVSLQKYKNCYQVL